MKIKLLSHRHALKANAGLRICAVLLKPPLFASIIKHESRHLAQVTELFYA